MQRKRKGNKKRGTVQITARIHINPDTSTAFKSSSFYYCLMCFAASGSGVACKAESEAIIHSASITLQEVDEAKNHLSDYVKTLIISLKTY